MGRVASPGFKVFRPPKGLWHGHSQVNITDVRSASYVCYSYEKTRDWLILSLSHWHDRIICLDSRCPAILLLFINLSFFLPFSSNSLYASLNLKNLLNNIISDLFLYGSYLTTCLWRSTQYLIEERASISCFCDRPLGLLGFPPKFCSLPPAPRNVIPKSCWVAYMPRMSASVESGIFSDLSAKNASPSDFYITICASWFHP